jgi:hypothetical protein
MSKGWRESQLSLKLLSDQLGIIVLIYSGMFPNTNVIREGASIRSSGFAGQVLRSSILDVASSYIYIVLISIEI